MHTNIENWVVRVVLLMVAASSGCAAEVDDGESIVGTAQALSTVIDIDFTNYALGPLGSPWTVTASGSGKASIVKTSDHGNVLSLTHGAERDFSSSTLPLSYTGSSFDFAFAVKPKTSESAFTVTLSSPKTGYKTPRFAVGFSRFSPDLTVESAATNGNGTCGPLPPGKWSVVDLKLRPEGTRHVVDVAVNGKLTAACTGVSTTLRVATLLGLQDNLQPSANAETSFDDFFMQAGDDGEI